MPAGAQENAVARRGGGADTSQMSDLRQWFAAHDLSEQQLDAVLRKCDNEMITSVDDLHQLKQSNSLADVFPVIITRLIEKGLGVRNNAVKIRILPSRDMLNVVWHGKLKKQGQKNRSWKEREFVLTSTGFGAHSLAYFQPKAQPLFVEGTASEALPVPKGKLNFQGLSAEDITVQTCVGTSMEGRQQGLRFQVKCGTRTLLMEAGTKQKMDEVLDKLSTCLKVPITHGPFEGTLLKKGPWGNWSSRCYSFQTVPGEETGGQLQYFKNSDHTFDLFGSKGSGFVRGIIGISDGAASKKNRFMIFLKPDVHINGLTQASGELELVADSNEEKEGWLQHISQTLREQEVTIYENQQLVKPADKFDADSCSEAGTFWSAKNWKSRLEKDDMQLPPPPITSKPITSEKYAMKWGRIQPKDDDPASTDEWHPDVNGRHLHPDASEKDRKVDRNGWSYGSDFSKANHPEKASHRFRRRCWVRWCILEPGCCVSECAEKRIPGRTCCSTHACPVSSCEEGSFCIDHKCSGSGCKDRNQYLDGRGSKFCMTHICQVQTCEHGKMPGHVNVFCSAHECHAPGCETRNQFSDGQGSSFCVEHGCSFSGCKEQKTAEGGQFCVGHECGSNNCKNQHIDGLHIFCIEHTCNDPSCKERNRNQQGYLCGSFCEEHGCSHSGCNAPTPDFVCEAHKCNSLDCEESNQFHAGHGSIFCTLHVCSVYVCEKERKRAQGKIFCNDHACDSEGCSKQRKESGYFSAVLGSSTYCTDHECSNSHCKAHNDKQSDMCSKHYSLVSDSTRKDIGNSRYGNGDAAHLMEPEKPEIQVKKMQWYEAPLSGAGTKMKLGNKVMGWKHSALIFTCEWVGEPGVEPFQLNLEKCEIDPDCEYTTIGDHQCLLLSHGGKELLSHEGKEGNLRTMKGADGWFEIDLTSKHTNLRQIVAAAEEGKGYTLERSNCHHMALDVFNYCRQKKGLAQLKESAMPNATQLQIARGVGLLKWAPGSASSAKSTSVNARQRAENNERQHWHLVDELRTGCNWKTVKKAAGSGGQQSLFAGLKGKSKSISYEYRTARLRSSGGSTEEARLLDKIRLLFEAGGAQDRPTHGFTVQHVDLVLNEDLQRRFDSEVINIEKRRCDDPSANSAFNKPVPGLDDGEKQGVLQRLEEHFRLAVFQRLDMGLDKTNILWLWHGCSAFVAEKICHLGLADLAITDGGFFGRGPYFTPQAQYAAGYASGLYKPSGMDEPDANGNYVMLLCLVGVGNVYPISRATDYHGGSQVSVFNDNKALMPGFDAHFVSVSAARNYQAAGARRADYDELVTKQETQALPFCKVYFRAN
jgi:hypothetical protein